MANSKGGETVNKGPAPETRPEDNREEFEIAGNARVKGEDPSPGDRDRGETSIADTQESSR